MKFYLHKVNTEIKNVSILIQEEMKLIGMCVSKICEKLENKILRLEGEKSSFRLLSRLFSPAKMKDEEFAKLQKFFDNLPNIISTFERMSLLIEQIYKIELIEKDLSYGQLIRLLKRALTSIQQTFVYIENADRTTLLEREENSPQRKRDSHDSIELRTNSRANSRPHSLLLDESPVDNQRVSSSPKAK